MQERLIDRKSDWYAGRPVMVTRNEYGMDIYNGDVGIALPNATKEGRLRAISKAGTRSPAYCRPFGRYRDGVRDDRA